MKTNHRRKNPPNSGFNYSVLVYRARTRVGLGADHDGGHRGSAKDVKEVKTTFRRIRRRVENRQVQKEVIGL